ncbi:hypothetical protein RFI_30252 [Reticulomyxa filosa]|uniref:Hikeshi-like C-terminal domain-containing protein n=1 Tax=Reticulomyxa filosa TaxID=46433 RepID=X6LZT2_RETFI|nr:hypothetical protein RFI_30252 [Reticulomyxa filosa]|eukprot:ETO07139.1 hypothetical protein RFI_30252 [Reticulomyxa filosa]
MAQNNDWEHGSNSSNNSNGHEKKEVKNVFCVMVPGRPVNTTCLQISPTRCIMDIPKPGECKYFGISIIDPKTIPKNKGFIIYYSLPPFNEWSFIGTLHLKSPTQMMESPWMVFKKITVCPMCKIGIELKDITFVQSLEVKEETEHSKNKFIATINEEFALKVAKDLYNYLSSYVKTSPNGEMMVCPASCLEKWHEKFKEKYVLDPKFMK